MVKRKAVKRWALALVPVVGFAVALNIPRAEAEHAVLYKDPHCGCCEAYARYLEQNGFEITVQDTDDLSGLKQQTGVPEGLEGCHTTLISGYAIEGHVSVTIIRRLLIEQPEIGGISLPGMPQGSPGMSGQKAEPFIVLGFNDQKSWVYAAE